MGSVASLFLFRLRLFMFLWFCCVYSVHGSRHHSMVVERALQGACPGVFFYGSDACTLEPRELPWILATIFLLCSA